MDMISVIYQKIKLSLCMYRWVSVVYDEISWVYMCMDVMSGIYEEMNLGIYV